jgi:hypothetical protein
MRSVQWTSWVTVAVLAACATAGKDVGQGVTVRSSSSEVRVRIREMESGKEIAAGMTPVTLRRQGQGYFPGGTYIVDVAKPGLPKKTFTLKLGAVVLYGGLLAWIIVDPDSGRIWLLRRERSGLVWTPAPGEESFERITGYVIATLDDVKSSAQATANMELLETRAR